MAWVFEDGRGGYLSEAMCPICGYPIVAILWDDGSVTYDECYVCTNKVGKAVKE